MRTGVGDLAVAGGRGGAGEGLGEVGQAPVGRDVASGRTVFGEYRLFFWKGRPLQYGAHDDGGGVWAEFARWEAYAWRFASPLITIDVARRTDGRWMTVETGDACVSGLPAVIPGEAFYRALREAVSGGGMAAS